MPTNDESEIRHLIETWARAVRERNLALILAHHAPDIVMFDVPPPAQSQGIEAYRKTWDLFFAWAQDVGIFDIRELRITASREVAFAVAIMRCGGREADGRTATLDFRLTIGLRKISGQWIVTHEHHSVPAA